MDSGDSDFTDQSMAYFISLKKKKTKKKTKKKKRQRRSSSGDGITKPKKIRLSSSSKKSTKQKAKPARRRLPRQQRRRGVPGSLEPGAVVIWTGRGGAIFMGTALPTNHARSAGTVWTGRGSGRHYKCELIRLSLCRGMPSQQLHYFHGPSGNVFVSKMRTVLLLDRGVASLAMAPLPAELLRVICSYFGSPEYLPHAVAAVAAEQAHAAAARAALMLAAAELAVMEDAAAMALVAIWNAGRN